MPFSAATHSDAHDRLQRFLARASTNAGDVAQLWRFLDDEPTRTPTTTALPADEVEERLSFLEHALRRSGIRTPLMEQPERVRPVDAWGLSMVFCLPLDSMRSLRSVVDNGIGTWTSFSGLSDDILRLSNIVMQRRSRSGTHEDSRVVVGRNRAEAVKCLTRDGGRCLFLGTPMAEVCHIIPYASGNTPHRCRMLRGVENASMALAGAGGVLLGDHPGSTDKDWNMLTLNPFLHILWARGLFALKCLGVAPLPDEAGALVAVQLHWMPTLPQRETAAPCFAWEEEVNAEDRVAWLRRWESRARYGSVASPHAGDADASTFTVSCSQTGRFIQTGHTVHITLPSMADGQRMRTMLNVQWGCIRMANMSGAAGDPEFLQDWDDDCPDADYYAPPPREDDVDVGYAEAPSRPPPDAEDAEAFSN